MMTDRIICFKCDRDLTEEDFVTLHPCSHHYCYRCMIMQQVDSSASTEGYGKRMLCSCGKHVDNHEWGGDSDGERSTVAHSDPKRPRGVETLNKLHDWYEDVIDRCESDGTGETLGEKGLLYTVQLSMNIDEDGQADALVNDFELSAGGEWLPQPDDAACLIHCCGLLHSATHPLSSTDNDGCGDEELTQSVVAGIGEDQIPTNISPTTTRKDVIVSTIIRLRKRLNGDQVKELVKEARRGVDLASTPEQRSREIFHETDKYYCFPDEAKSVPEFSETYPVADLKL